jgi:hypothetical protein
LFNFIRAQNILNIINYNKNTIKQEIDKEVIKPGKKDQLFYEEFQKKNLKNVSKL